MGFGLAVMALISVPLTAPFAGLTQNEDLPYPLGWRGEAYVDD